MATVDNSAVQQQQQQAQAAAQAQAQAKAGKTDAPKSIQFSEVLKNQQQQGSQASVKMLKENPVAGAEVVKQATAANKPSGSSKASIAPNAASAGSAPSTTSTSSSQQATLDASSQMMQQNQDFNLQYLMLQENVQAESRQYTAMSNVSKTKSDTAKNSLSNVK